MYLICLNDVSEVSSMILSLISFATFLSDFYLMIRGSGGVALGDYS